MYGLIGQRKLDDKREVRQLKLVDAIKGLPDFRVVGQHLVVEIEISTHASILGGWDLGGEAGHQLTFRSAINEGSLKAIVTTLMDAWQSGYTPSRLVPTPRLATRERLLTSI